MSKLKQKKYWAILGIVLLVLGTIGLVVFGRPDKYKGLVKVSDIKLSTKVLSSVGEAAKLESKGYDEVNYTLNYTLDEIEGLTSRDVVIKGTLTDEDFKYARFKDISNGNVSSEVQEEGKVIEITVNDVKLGEAQTLDIKLVIEGAPNGTNIKPVIEIKEKTGEFTRTATETIEVVTNSLEGTVTDESGTPIDSIELSINSNNEEVKRTYTNENGKFIFTDLNVGTYTIKVEEEIYELVGDSTVNVENNSNLSIIVKQISPYSIETHKYINNLNLIINGKEEKYSYKDAEKVVQSVKNAKTIEGTIEYKIVVKNTGEKEGTVTRVLDEPGEGLEFNKDSNKDWEEKDGNLYYKPIEGATLKVNESREIKLVLNITNTKEIKTYLNKLTATGEVYEKVVYVIDGKVYKEDEVLQGESVSKPKVSLENFTGWFSDKNYTNKYSFGSKVNKDLILYGYTLDNKCKVTFMDMGTVYEEQEVICGKKASKPTDPKHEGYKFKEWQDERGKKFNFDEVVDNDTVIESKYTLVTYTITYNYNGGSLEEGKTNPSTYTIESNDITLNNPSKSGYTFIGWTEKDGDTPNITVTINTGSTGNKTYTANYEIIDYTITYNLDGGSLEEGKNNKNKYTVETEDFTLNNPSKKGYTFVGWIGTGLSETTENVTIKKGSTGNREYTAIYKTKKYTITYKGLTESEIENLNNPTEYTVETENFTLVNPSNRTDSDGDTSEIFVGWTGSNGENASTEVLVTKGSTGNKEFTANFIDADPEVYPITYDLENGSLEEGKTNPTSYTKKDESFTLNNPSKKGYNFIGWTGTDLSENTLTVTIAKGSRGARSYQANYSANEYAIEYDLDGGSLAEGVSNPTTYTIETEDFTLNNPTKLGYTFIGWVGTKVDDPSTNVTITKGSTGNRTYTAKYVKNKYTITYNYNGGSLEEGKTNPTEYYVDTEDFTLNNPSKEGYTFIGWTSETITTLTETVTVSVGSTGDINFVANYEVINYTITYNLNDGTLGENITNPDTYNIETEDFTLNNPSKEGYRFRGWTGTGLSNRSTEVTIKKGSTGNREYEAVYGPNSFIIKFMVENSLFLTNSVDYNNPVSKPTSSPASSNGIFLYWSLENKPYTESPVEYDFTTPIVQDTTLYAILEPIEAPIISQDPTEWTNGNVTVTISSSHEDYSYMYKIDDGNYQSYSTPFTVEENCTIYAYSVKASAKSEEVSHEITNIDKINPRVNNLTASSVRMNSFTINVAAADDESGIDSVVVYKDDELVGDFKNENDDNSEKISSITLSNLSENTSYMIKAIPKDKAGNLSEAIEKEITTQEMVVARIIGENNTSFDEENYINFSSLKEAIEYEDCVSNQCTIQMVQGTNESNIILEGQDITLDLNGSIIFGENENYTLQNNGRLKIIDSNTTDQGIIYNSNGTALTNETENSILTVGENEEVLVVSTEKPRIIGNTYGVNKKAGRFNFYDGYIEGTSAINGTVDDTPYLYNARISSIAHNDSTIKQKAILNIVADAEARIGSTYYTKLKDAIDKSNIGMLLDPTYIETTFDSEDSIITYGDYGFSSLNGQIVPDSEHYTESRSIIPIDLTEETNDKLLLITYDIYDYNYSYRPEVNRLSTYLKYEKIGSINISDSITGLSDINIEIEEFGVYNYDSITFGKGNGFTTKTNYDSTGIYKPADFRGPVTKSISLEKGKVYYLSFEGNVKINDLQLGTTGVMNSISEIPNYTIQNGSLLYGFEYDEATKTLKNNNSFKSGTTAFSYYEIDLTGKTQKYNLTTNLSFDVLTNRNDYIYVLVSKDSFSYNLQTYKYEGDFVSYNQIQTSNIYLSGPPHADFGPKIYTSTTELEPGHKYYLQLYYMKYPDSMDQSTYDSLDCKDLVTINSIDLTPISSSNSKNISTEDLITPGEYGFNSTGTTNTSTNTTAHSYVELDMQNEINSKIININLTYRYEGLYLALTDSTDLPSTNDAFYTSPYNYYSNTANTNIGVDAGTKKYLHFVFDKKSYNAEAKINSINIEDATSYDLSKTLNSYTRGLTDYEGGAYKKKELKTGDTVDSYVRIDLTNAKENQIIIPTVQFSQYAHNYIYVADSPKNATYQYMSSHKNDSVLYLEPNYSYYYLNNRKTSVYSFSYEYPFILPKGRVYYVHFASSLQTNQYGGYTPSSTSSLSLYSLVSKPLSELPLHIGKTPTIIHGDQEKTLDDQREDFITNDGTVDANARFISKDANNYVKFNNELWRIIGVFDTEDENGNVDKRMKIVRNDSIGGYPYDSSPNDSNNSGMGTNEWSQAKLMKLMNPGYEKESIGGSLYWNNKDGNCYTGARDASSECGFETNNIGLKDSAKEFIDDAVWNTGSLNTDDYTIEELYNIERGDATGKDGITREKSSYLDDVERTTSWTGKVGLLYASDAIYAMGKESTYTYNNEEINLSRSECIEHRAYNCVIATSWLYNQEEASLWTITPTNSSAYNVVISNAAPVRSTPSVATLFVRPTIYLSDKTIISGGIGSTDDPFTLTLGNTKNSDNDYGLVEKSNSDSFIKDETEDKNYRFIGSNPNNYVSFNDELWRIIGIFNVDDGKGNKSYRIKLIRSTAIGNFAWDTSVPDTNTGYGINEWSQADIMKLLNPNYSDNKDLLFASNKYEKTDKVNNSLYWDKKSGICFSSNNNYYSNCDFTSTGLSDESKEYIDTVKWNLGAILNNTSSLTPYDIYNYERGEATGKTDFVNTTNYPIDNVERTTYWYGKVALPYASDYIMAMDTYYSNTREICMNGNSSYYGSCSSNNNWMNKSGYQVMLSPMYGNGSNGMLVSGGSTTLSSSSASSPLTIRPTVYLSTKVNIKEGKGTSTDPYILELKQTKNSNKYYGILDEVVEANASPDPISDDYKDINTDDYKKIKNIPTYGFTYDEETNTFINDNYAVPNSLASSTVTLDLTRETNQKEITFKQNYYDSQVTFFIVNENPEPVNYSQSNTSCTTVSNCRVITGNEGSFYLEPGKVYYIHLGYLYHDYYPVTNTYKNMYGNVHTLQIEIDGGTYSTTNLIKNYTYERNDDIDTVQVLKNIVLDYQINIEKERSVILDLNGYTLTSATSTPMINNSGELEIIDSKLDTFDESDGKLVNNNTTVVLNDLGGNLKLTSGKIETEKDAVRNIGTMQMDEKFEISSDGIAINNIDGIINDISGKITKSSYGIYTDKENLYNKDDSGLIKNISGPLDITASNTGIYGVSEVSNVTINAGVGINSGYKELNISNSTITAETGIVADSIKNIEDVTITATDVGIKSKLNENTIFKNVNIDANTVFNNMTGGDFILNDDVDLTMVGSITNNGKLVIDLKEKVLQKKDRAYDIFNIGEMEIKSFAETDTDNKIQSSGTLSMNNLIIDELYAYQYDSITIKDTDMNLLNISSGNTNNLLSYDDGTVKQIIGASASAVAVLNNITVDNGDATSTLIDNHANLTLKNSTINGNLNNMHGSDFKLENGTIKDIINNGYSSSYLGDAKLTIKNSEAKSITNGTEYFYGARRSSNKDIVTIINSTINGDITNNANGILTLGEKDGNMSKDNIKTKKITNLGAVNFYDGTVTSTDTYPISGEGIINDVEDNYYLDSETTGGNNSMFLSSNPEVCKIGDTKYPSIKKAIESIEDSSALVEINVIKSHSTSDKIVNDKNIIINLNEYTINEYSEGRYDTIDGKSVLVEQPFITNNETGILSLTGVLDKAYILHGGATNSTYANNPSLDICSYGCSKINNFSSSLGDTDIVNYGDLTINGIKMYGGALSSNGSVRMISGEIDEIATYTGNSTVTIDEGKMDALTNRGTATINDITAKYIYNYKNITIEKNNPINSNYETEYVDYNEASTDKDNVWIKSGTYKFIHQTNISSGTYYSSYYQTINIGDDTKEVIVRNDVNLTSGSLIMKNSTVSNGDNTTYGVYTKGTATISNSKIYTKATTSSERYALNSSNGDIELKDSTVSCTYSRVTYKCYGVTGSSITSTNSSISGYYGVQGSSYSMYGGSINSYYKAVYYSGGNVNIVDGTITSTNNAIDTYSEGIHRSSTINIGTDSEHKILGSPSITSNSYYGIYTSDNVDVYFANGTITANNGIYGGSYQQSNSNYSYPTNIYVGTIMQDGININPTINSTENAITISTTTSTSSLPTYANIVVKRGTLTSNKNAIYSTGNYFYLTIGDTEDDDVSKEVPSISGKTSGIDLSSSTNYNLYFYDGVIRGTKSKSINATITKIEKDYILITEDEENNIEKNYLDLQKIAKVNNVEYNTLNEAITAANNNDTIELLMDYTFVNSMDTTIIPYDKEITIDFKSHTVTNKSTKNYITNNGTLVIENMKTTGSDAKITNNGTMTINSSTITSTVINNLNKEITINDGTYSNISNIGNMNILDGTIDSMTISNGTLDLVSGSISDLNSSGGVVNIGIKDTVVSETKPTVNKINYTTADGVVNFYDGVIGSTGHMFTSTVQRNYLNEIETGYNVTTKENNALYLSKSNIIRNVTKDSSYSNVNEAITDSDSGDTLQLLTSTVLTNDNTTITIPTDKNIIFDFNGNNIYTSNKLFINNGTLTIKSSKETNPSLQLLSIENNGTLNTIDDIYTIETFNLVNNGTATIGNFTANVFNYTNNENATLNMNTVVVKDGTQVNNGTLVIDTSTDYNLNITNNGTATLKNMNISKYNPLFNNNGTLTIEDSIVFIDFNNSLESSVINIINSNFRSAYNDSNKSTLNNKGTINISGESTLVYGYTVINDNTINVNDGVVADFVVTNNGTFNQYGGTLRYSPITSTKSTSIINIEGGILEGKYSTSTVIILTNGADATISNATAEIIKVTQPNSIIDITNESSVSKIITENDIDGLTINVKDSEIETLEIDSTSNYLGSSKENEKTNSYINLNSSVIKNIYNNSKEIYDRNDYYKIYNNNILHLTGINSNITGNNLNVNTIEMIGGEINSALNYSANISESNKHYSFEIPYASSCKFTDIKINNNITCGTTELITSEVTGNISGNAIITKSTITGNISNASTATIDDSVITGNINGSNIEMKSGTVNGYISGTDVTILSGTVTSTDSTAVTTTGNLVLGVDDEEVSTQDPVISGNPYGVSSDGVLSFYDGTITGDENALTVKLTNIPSGYKINLLTIGGKSNATLLVAGEDEIVADTNNKFFADLQAAVNDCNDGGTVRLHRDVELETTLVIPDGKTIIIDLNNHQIINEELISGNYSTIDSTNPNPAGAIYRFLANLTGTEINAKNIIVYQMEDGEALKANETYKLYKLIDNQYKVVEVNEDSIGTYDIGSETEVIRTVKGRVYLNGIGEGNYKLISNTNRELDFIIGEANISSNIKENPNLLSGKLSASTVATLILTLQTGVIRTPYLLMLLILIILIIFGYAIVKKNKKSYEK